MQALSGCGEWRLLFVVVSRLLSAVGPLLQSTGSRAQTQWLWGMDMVAGCGPGRSVTRGIFPDQGLNLHLPH